MWSVRRWAQLTSGLLLYTVSIALIIHAGLGAMPWDVLTQGIVLHSPWSFGTVTAAIGVIVLLAWIPLRQRPGVGTIANVVVISALIDPALTVVAYLPSGLAGRIVALVAGVLLNGVATGLYIGAHLGPGPRDGLMTGLVRRTGGSVRVIRTSIEVIVVGSGWLLGGTVGWGTLLYAVAIGPLVHLLLPRLAMTQALPTGEADEAAMSELHADEVDADPDEAVTAPVTC